MFKIFRKGEEPYMGRFDKPLETMGLYIYIYVCVCIYMCIYMNLAAYETLCLSIYLSVSLLCLFLNICLSFLVA